MVDMRLGLTGTPVDLKFASTGTNQFHHPDLLIQSRLSSQFPPLLQSDQDLRQLLGDH
jgi:hypothetical protein